MGKGEIPLYSWHNGQPLDYISARKKIYIPLYERAVELIPELKRLRDGYAKGHNIALRDFDGYDHRALNMTFSDVVNCKDKKMGHAFVLFGMLTREPLVY